MSVWNTAYLAYLSVSGCVFIGALRACIINKLTCNRSENQWMFILEHKHVKLFTWSEKVNYEPISLVAANEFWKSPILIKQTL